MITSCSICGSQKVFAWKQRDIDRPLQPSDLQITDKRYGITLALWKCEVCGFIFADGADLHELLRLYSQLEDPDYEGSLDARLLQMKWLLKTGTHVNPSAQSLLDIGAGAGLLVHEAKKQGLTASGVEPSGSLVTIARERFGVDLLHGTFPHPALAGQKFDMVFLIDVIEHVSDPLLLLTSCRAALSRNGVLILVTPDICSVAARVLGKKWWHLRLAHVCYFNRKTITAAARKCGLEPVRFLRARWFFPVGYLTECLANYLPVGWLNRLSHRSALARWIGRRIIPLNLRDSWVAILKTHEEKP